MQENARLDLHLCCVCVSEEMRQSFSCVLTSGHGMVVKGQTSYIEPPKPSSRASPFMVLGVQHIVQKHRPSFEALIRTPFVLVSRFGIRVEAVRNCAGVVLDGSSSTKAMSTWKLFRSPMTHLGLEPHCIHFFVRPGVIQKCKQAELGNHKEQSLESRSNVFLVQDNSYTHQ